MKQAMQIQLALLNNRFWVERAEDIKGGERFYLGVGVVISVYDNGTVLVQGRLKPKYKTWAVKILTRLLPKNTRWSNT